MLMGTLNPTHSLCTHSEENFAAVEELAPTKKAGQTPYVERDMSLSDTCSG